jgi:hypothetical protein
MTRPHVCRKSRGQTLVEFALVLPLFTLVFAGVIIFGIGVFYQQQLTNAAREAARYAAIHSATSICPTTSHLQPNLNQLPADFNLADYPCDPPSAGWPLMSAYARSKVFGLTAADVRFSACWSGYWDGTSYDAPPVNGSGAQNPFHPCTIGGVDPRTSAPSIPCPAPATTIADDQASNLAATAATTSNQVTVYACYNWSPPFISAFTGGTVKMQAVITEAMQHQR